jgi:hypothetical protein
MLWHARATAPHSCLPRQAHPTWSTRQCPAGLPACVRTPAWPLDGWVSIAILLFAAGHYYCCCYSPCSVGVWSKHWGEENNDVIFFSATLYVFLSKHLNININISQILAKQNTSNRRKVMTKPGPEKEEEVPSE